MWCVVGRRLSMGGVAGVVAGTSLQLKLPFAHPPLGLGLLLFRPQGLLLLDVLLLQLPRGHVERKHLQQHKIRVGGRGKR